MISRVVRKPCYGISEVCTRWAVTDLDVANFAIGRELTLSVVAARLPVEEGEVDEVDDGHFVDIPERQHWFNGQGMQLSEAKRCSEKPRQLLR